MGNNLPASFIRDPSAEFLPGMLAQLTVSSNTVMATVSDGTAPLGIIDDIRTRAFAAPAWNEVITVPVPNPVLNGNNQLVTPVNIQTTLAHAYIDSLSFLSSVDVALIPTNGVITFLAGTPLNYDAIGSGTPNAIRTICNYTYQVPNIPGDDSTLGSGRITVWFSRMFFQTDQFETNQVYPVNANLFCNEHGLFTTRKPTPISPSIAILTAPPQPQNPMIEALLL